MTPLVSVIFPTRGRQGLVHSTVASLRDTAVDPGRVEILIAVDPDDAGAWCLALPDWLNVTITPERYGYGRLHEYYNHLAQRARGEWLLMWNDDAVMETPGWDGIIASQEAPAVLWPYCPVALGMNVFPVWPAAWARHLGHVSLTHSCDMWVQAVGEKVGRTRHIPVIVQHLCVSDRTAAERNPRGGYDTPDMLAGRDADAAALREFLKDAPEANTRLVSVLAAQPHQDVAERLEELLRLAADPANVEFLVTGEGFRGELERAGIMGYGEVHGSGTGLERWSHGRWQVRLEDVKPVAGWDKLVRR